MRKGWYHSKQKHHIQSFLTLLQSFCIWPVKLMSMNNEYFVTKTILPIKEETDFHKLHNLTLHAAKSFFITDSHSL